LLISQLVLYTSSADAQEIKHEAKEIIIKATMQINLVMVGSSWSSAADIQAQLMKSYKPIIAVQNRTAGVEFVYNYNFVDAPASLSNELFSYIDSIAVDSSDEPPNLLLSWLDEKYDAFEILVDGVTGNSYLHCLIMEHECKSQLPQGVDASPQCVYQTCALYMVHYKWIDASLVDKWLHDKFPAEDGYTIYFFRPSAINYYHSYGIMSEDVDKGKEFKQESMMGFGGKYRSYFIDLAAGPSFYPVVPIESIPSVFHGNIFDIASEQDFQKLIINYINDAVMLLFTSSYLYEPTYKSRYIMDIFIIDQTSGKSFATIAPQYLKNSKLEASMKSMAPFAEWKFKVEGKSFDWLPHELSRAVIKSMSFKTYEGFSSINISSETLQTELDKWKKSIMTEEEAAELAKDKESSVYLPVIILVFDAFAYVDDGALLEQAKNLQPFKSPEPEAKPEPAPQPLPPILEEPNVSIGDISIAMKMKKKSTLMSVKNTGDAEVYGVKIKVNDGSIRFVKAKGWEREKVDSSTVMVKTVDRPISAGKSLIVMLVADRIAGGIEWAAIDAAGNTIVSGAAIPR
jgi:hypothetical protein